MKVIQLLIFCFILNSQILAESGYDLWLRYPQVSNTQLKQSYVNALGSIKLIGNSETIKIICNELHRAIPQLLDTTISVHTELSQTPGLIIGKWADIKFNFPTIRVQTIDSLGSEGYLIRTIPNKQLLITSTTDIGLLYGTFHLLRQLQQQLPIENLNVKEVPRLKLRMLNHWDNLDRTVERGYAGISIWDWHKLPDYIDPRYIDYARANASIGINGTVVTNVNANARALTLPYLQKLATLANIMRPYGIKVFLTARFSAPIEIGYLNTADPLNPEVQSWWNAKAKEIYQMIPDFGGFLVKANSEGQPGPQDYQRTHAEGANMLADALAPYGGIVVWRAFVYSQEIPDDRHKQAYNEFLPLDGMFRANVLVQVKNGAIDFQPREPFHPLFGAMKKTPLMVEFQITQEYTGCATHLFYQAPLYKETLHSDTYRAGKGATVAKVIDGSLYKNNLTGMAGVSNIGNEINWCGHPFAQANWYAFGRLAWNHELTAEQIAGEWLKMTFTTHPEFVTIATKLMMDSRENLVNYMTPLGLHHIMAQNHHYGPGPWVSEGRPDWTSVYYHKADSLGLGFNRTLTGSNAVSQYAPEVCQTFGHPETCPEPYLLWFHHINWNQTLNSGKTLWEELCNRYYSGATSVVLMQQKWEQLRSFIDEERFTHVAALLRIQASEALWWRDACVLYFQGFSKMPIPANLQIPDQKLEYYMKLEHRYVPGIKNE